MTRYVLSTPRGYVAGLFSNGTVSYVADQACALSWEFVATAILNALTYAIDAATVEERSN